MDDQDWQHWRQVGEELQQQIMQLYNPIQGEGSELQKALNVNKMSCPLAAASLYLSMTE